ncbi:NmrA family NAD(P)-binding protein [Streptomyces sp. NPDC048514]|uniref:NmrA family NAD(P)-binding protein n=1 Tax=Streptomyces sp. NPDC048514 TaxID=3365564 RepID=UPI0037218988
MSIAVTAATGHVGSRVVRLLVQAGVRPRVLVRDPARLDAQTRGLVEVRRGDLTDAGYVRAATAGARTVFWVDPTPHTADDPVETSRRTAAALAAAARDGDVARIVFLSSVGAERRHGMGHIDGLARIEELFDESGADVLHLRCGYFFSNLLLSLDELRQGTLTTAADPDQPIAWVDPRDIGEVVAARLLNEAWRGRLVQAVHGPEDLTFSQVAQVLSEVLGRPVRLRSVADDDVRATLGSAGLPPKAVEGIVGVIAGTRGLVPEQPRALITTTPTPLNAWAYACLRPLLAG